MRVIFVLCFFVISSILCFSESVYADPSVFESDTGAGTFDDPHEYELRIPSLGIGWKIMRGQTVDTPPPIIRDASGDVVENRVVGGWIEINSNFRQKELKQRLKLIGPSWIAIEPSGVEHTHAISAQVKCVDDLGKTFTTFNRINDRKIFYEGIQTHVAGVRVDDEIRERTYRWRTVMERDSEWNGSVELEAEHTGAESLSPTNLAKFVFSFDNHVGLINGTWTLKFEVTSDGLSECDQTYTGDFGGSNPDAIGTSLDAFACDALPFLVLGPYCGVVADIAMRMSDAYQWRDFIDQHPHPITYSFDQWTSAYIMENWSEIN